jgi:hypothetical protein
LKRYWERILAACGGETSKIRDCRRRRRRIWLDEVLERGTDCYKYGGVWLGGAIMLASSYGGGGGSYIIKEKRGNHTS